MVSPVSILKNKLFWIIATFLLFIAFPRPFKRVGKFIFSKLIPNMALIASIISTLPLHKLNQPAGPIPMENGDNSEPR